MKRTLLLAAAVPFLWACDDDSLGPDGAGFVGVRFQAVPPPVTTTQGVTAKAANFDHVSTGREITLTGTNGTLVLQDIRLIVAELELERQGGECTDRRDDDDCSEFEAGPFVASLLDGSASRVVRDLIPGGTYTALEFEVEDLDIDDDDSASERQTKEQLLAEIRQDYPNFPDNASMVVHGTFNGQPFTVYFEADIEVEMAFSPPFRVPEDGEIIVDVSPAAWFQQGNQVTNLLALDGQTVDFEAEIENGFVEVEFN